MTAVLGEILQLLTSGLVEYGQGIGTALSGMVGAMFIDTTGDTMALSIFGGVVVVFAAISLAVGLTKLVFNFITGFGQSY